jgi:membrane protease YdiL (CAAX protease family)
MEPVEPSLAEPRPWGVAATFVWAALAMVAGQGLGIAALIWRLGELGPDNLATAGYDGPVVALVTLVGNPLQILVLAGAARLRGHTVWRYLGLTGFRARDFAVGLAAVVALVLAISMVGWLIGKDQVTPFQVDIYASATSAAWLAALFTAVVIIAPLGEEIVFRGFLFRGWVGGYPVPAVVAIAVLWSALHIQYDWFGMLQVFLIGLVLGWVRWRSGSVLLTCVLHALMNLESVVETVVKVG